MHVLALHVQLPLREAWNAQLFVVPKPLASQSQSIDGCRVLSDFTAVGSRHANTSAAVEATHKQLAAQRDEKRHIESERVANQEQSARRAQRVAATSLGSACGAGVVATLALVGKMPEIDFTEFDIALRAALVCGAFLGLWLNWLRLLSCVALAVMGCVGERSSQSQRLAC